MKFLLAISGLVAALIFAESGVLAESADKPPREPSREIPNPNPDGPKLLTVLPPPPKPSCVAPIGSVIALKADNGKWLGRCFKCQKSVNDSYPDTVTAHLPAQGQYSSLKVVDAGNGWIGLQADNSKYVARCDSCIVGAPKMMLTIHRSTPWKLKLVALPGGKCGLQLDNGQYAGRCNQCSPGATVDDIVAIKDANTSSVHTQFEMVIVTPASAAAAAGGGNAPRRVR